MKPSRPSLLIIGHGSSESNEAEEAVREHVVTLKQSQRYGFVGAQFLKGRSVPPELPEGEVFLLPFFMSQGYFVSQTIPRLFDLNDGEKTEGHRRILLCDAVGVDPALSEILDVMAMEICRDRQYHVKDVTILLVAHGSAKSTASSEATRLQAEMLLNRSDFNTVSVAFLEEAPTLTDWLAKERNPLNPVIIIGLFAAEGPHAVEDVPNEIQDGQKRFRQAYNREPGEVHYAGVVGTRPEIVRLIQQSVSRRAGSA